MRGPVILLLVTAAAAVVPSAQARPVRLTVAASGDFLMHEPVIQRAERGGFRRMFRHIRGVIAGADLALCHMEVPLGGPPFRGYPLFRAPRTLAGAVAATGWDACSTASNHTLDGGQADLASTLRALDRAGLAHHGSARTAAEARRIPLLRTRGGVRVAFISYTAIDNGQRHPHPWSLNELRVRRVIADARRARAHGADAVIANLHWGDEYRHAPSASQLRTARALARARVLTAIVGQHAHVVQPIRRIGGLPVVFGEGNLLSNQSGVRQDGLIVLLRITADAARGTARVTRVDYVPTWVRKPDFAVLPARRRSGSATLRASWRRTVSVVGDDRIGRAVR